MYNARGNSGSRTSVMDGDRLFTLKSKAYYSSSNIADNELMNISVDGTVSTNIVPTRTDFNTVNSAGATSTALTLRSSGNVGIGTTNPDHKLHISSTGNTTARIDAAANSRSALQFAEVTGAFGTAATGFELAYNGADDKFMFRRATGSSIDTVMTMDRSSGYVGIQNHSPSATLDVGGAIRVDTVAATPVDGMIQFNGTDFEGYVGGNWKSLTTTAATCPGGMTAAGPSMCIETAERGATTWFTAATTCGALGYKLPTWAEWYTGVTLGVGLSNTTDDWEWVDGGTSNTVRKVGNGGTTNTANDTPTNSVDVTFRCVYYLR